MSIQDLSNQHSVQSAVFVKLETPDNPVEYFSSFHRPETIEGEVYAPMGSLLNITDITDNLRASEGEVVVAISGIPSANIDLLLSAKFKGSRLTIYRGFYSQSGSAIGTPTAQFRGIISNFEIADDIDGRTGTVVLTLTASNFISVLANKFAGRRTSSADHRRFFPDDPSMDRVTAVANSNFNFGAPRG